MQDEVKVTQADREAAYGAYFECYDTAPNDLWLQAMLEGRHDEDSLIQVLARHRHQAERETLARMDPVYFVPTFQGHDFYRFPPQKTKPDKIHEGWSYVPLYALPPAPEAGQ